MADLTIGEIWKKTDQFVDSRGLQDQVTVQLTEGVLLPPLSTCIRPRRQRTLTLGDHAQWLMLQARSGAYSQESHVLAVASS